MYRALQSTVLLLAITFKAAPVLTTIELASTVLLAVGGPLQAFGLALMVNGLAQGGGMMTGLVVIMTGLIATFGSRIASSAVQSSMEDKLEARLNVEIMSLTGSIPGIAHHEVPAIADRMTLVREESRELKYGATSIGAGIAVLISSLTILAMIVSVHPWLALLPLLAIVRVLMAARAGRLILSTAKETALHHRMIDRLTDISREPKHAIEIRTFGLQKFLVENFKVLHYRRDIPRWATLKRAARLDIVGRLIFTLGYGAAILFVLSMAIDGTVTPGDVALVVLLVPQMDRAATGMVDATRQTARTIGTVDNFRWLRSYAAEQRESMGEHPAPKRLDLGLKVRSVSFTYPGADKPALHDVNLTIPAGSTVAFVGENGAGKSTMINLLARFYEPTHGSIRVDSTDLADIEQSQWRQTCSAGFQDFVKYEFTAGEAIGLGDLPNLTNPDAIAAAADRGDATKLIGALPNGLDSQLGRKFTGGIDLSGGQWQRLALSRSFMRASPLLLMLDEPTAAIDPGSEHELFERIAAASNTRGKDGAITILVSHRFSTVRMADLIFVFEQGQVTEIGSHKELMRLRGHYAELFNLQAKAYR